MEYRSDYFEYQCESHSYYSLYFDPGISTRMYRNSDCECNSECVTSGNFSKPDNLYNSVSDFNTHRHK